MFFKRLAQIFGIIIQLFSKSLSGPERLRIFFERSGGAFVKLGQILALRQDFLPFPYIQELLKLLNRLPPVPLNQIRIVFTEEMGRPPEVFFTEFDPEPIASASIAQVYKARLKDGAKVAVKIQRPRVREIFEADFKVVAFLALIIDFFKFFSSIYAQDIAKEFISWSRRELDFTIEAKNADIIYNHSRDFPLTIVPKQYLELTKPRALIQELIESGVSAEDVISKGVDKNYLIQNDIDTNELANYFITDMMRQYFIDGFFHADPHPANLIFLPHNRLAYLDFGIVGESKYAPFSFLKIFYGIAQKDVEYISRSILEFGGKILNKEFGDYLKKDAKQKKGFEKIFEKLKELMLKDLTIDIGKIFNPWFDSVSSSTAPLSEKSSAAIFLKLIKVSENYSVHLPREMVLYFRTLSILDMVGLQMSPTFDMIKALNLFFEKYSLEELEIAIKEKDHSKEMVEKIISVTDETDADWEVFKEIAANEREKIRMAKERAIELVISYSGKYEEIRSLIKTLK